MRSRRLDRFDFRSGLGWVDVGWRCGELLGEFGNLSNGFVGESVIVRSDWLSFLLKQPSAVAGRKRFGSSGRYGLLCAISGSTSRSGVFPDP